MDINGKICRWTDMFKTHPYVMYAKTAEATCSESNINPQGFRGPEYPLKKLDKSFTILFTGGSVAEDQMGSDKITSLEKVLNENYKIDGYDNFKVLVGAMAGWRQPSQLIMLNLYSTIIHGVIVLDGYNEFELISSPKWRMAGYPADPFVMQGVNNQLDIIKFIFALCDGDLFRHQLNSKYLIHFRTYYHLTQMIRQTCRNKVEEMSANESTYMSFFTFPLNSTNDKERQNYNEKMFLSYIRNMHAVAKSNHIKELYFIQPAPAVQKKLTDDERLVAQDLSYGPLYTKMTTGRMALNSENIRVVSLLNIFENNSDRLYNDRIHLNDHGRKILEKNLLLNLEKYWHIKKKI